MQTQSQQKLWAVFLETEKGHVRQTTVRATSSTVAGNRAMKRVPGAVAVHRVEKAAA